MDKIKDTAAAVIMLIALALLFIGISYGVAMFYAQGSLI